MIDDTEEESLTEEITIDDTEEESLTEEITIAAIVESGMLSRLSGRAAVATYLSLVALAERGIDNPRHTDLADLVGTSRNTIGSTIQQLLDLGLIDRDDSDQRHRYALKALPSGPRRLPTEAQVEHRRDYRRSRDRSRKSYRGTTYRSPLERSIAFGLDLLERPFAYEVPYAVLFEDLKLGGLTMDFVLAPRLGIEVAGVSTPEYRATLERKQQVAADNGFGLVILTEGNLDRLKHILAEQVVAHGERVHNERFRRAVQVAKRNDFSEGFLASLVQSHHKFHVDPRAVRRVSKRNRAADADLGDVHAALDDARTAVEASLTEVLSVKAKVDQLVEENQILSDSDAGLLARRVEAAMRRVEEADDKLARSVGRLTGRAKSWEEREAESKAAEERDRRQSQAFSLYRRVAEVLQGQPDATLANRRDRRGKLRALLAEAFPELAAASSKDDAQVDEAVDVLEDVMRDMPGDVPLSELL